MILLVKTYKAIFLLLFEKLNKFRAVGPPLTLVNSIHSELKKILLLSLTFENLRSQILNQPMLSVESKFILVTQSIT